jgi:hypothetical protein
MANKLKFKIKGENFETFISRLDELSSIDDTMTKMILSHTTKILEKAIKIEKTNNLLLIMFFIDVKKNIQILNYYWLEI